MPPSLNEAPEEMKLAVDLIYLLESHQIAPDIAKKALLIVLADLNRQLDAAASSTSSKP